MIFTDKIEVLRIFHSLVTIKPVLSMKTSMLYTVLLAALFAFIMSKGQLKLHSLTADNSGQAPLIQLAWFYCCLNFILGILDWLKLFILIQESLEKNGFCFQFYICYP